MAETGQYYQFQLKPPTPQAASIQNPSTPIAPTPPPPSALTQPQQQQQQQQPRPQTPQQQSAQQQQMANAANKANVPNRGGENITSTGKTQSHFNVNNMSDLFPNYSHHIRKRI